MDKNKEILKKVSEQFSIDTFFVPVTGAEIEFYLIGQIPENIIDVISSKCQESNIGVLEVKKEEGQGQYEISLSYIKDPTLLADRILQAKGIVNQLANDIGLKADFSAQPVKGDYGSSLHIHISLLDKAGVNVLQKNGEDESVTMLYAIGGLLELMPASMKYFAPYDKCYERFAQTKDSPSTISWGGNNRTVAIRLPTTTSTPQNRRIEHRVACADANPYLSIACILAGVSYGIVNKKLPVSDKIYGDASLDMYNLPALPSSFKNAEKIKHEYLDNLSNGFL